MSSFFSLSLFFFLNQNTSFITRYRERNNTKDSFLAWQIRNRNYPAPQRLGRGSPVCSSYLCSESFMTCCK
ncbi:hypothetical protein EDB82DRAFT_114448 [Fusarium venenatum]|uniref:uncharacterized protein n=1 Tax=Fusarium venenatum TaxID=56646 RepID=UPI001D9A624D|nr:hypothetical protein EDB82DRAFT_114448 [Fusarium venenatum]